MQMCTSLKHLGALSPSPHPRRAGCRDPGEQGYHRGISWLQRTSDTGETGTLLHQSGGGSPTACTLPTTEAAKGSARREGWGGLNWRKEQGALV